VKIISDLKNFFMALRKQIRNHKICCIKINHGHLEFKNYATTIAATILKVLGLGQDFEEV